VAGDGNPDQFAKSHAPSPDPTSGQQLGFDTAKEPRLLNHQPLARRRDLSAMYGCNKDPRLVCWSGVLLFEKKRVALSA
jgi:hypothetical protein